MKLSTPRWWYARDGRSGRVVRTLLRPVSWIWTWATARRIRAGQPIDPGVPVICVGNVTVGGAGKTPIVRELLVQLTRHGLKAHGLSRGHGGRLKGPMQVDPDRHSAADVGDEPLMLAQDFPVWVSQDRAAGVRAAAEAGAQVIVMDDGHQNPSVRKSLSLVVVDGETRDGEWPFGDGAVFPSGPMREPLAVGLARADAVVVLMPKDAGPPAPDLLAEFAGKPVLVARLEPAARAPAGPQLAFAGVGKPWKVERALRESGLALVDFASFPDHAEYDDRTLEFLAAHARNPGAGLLTTEKDWVRLSTDWRTRVKAWPVRARFEDQKALDQLLGFKPKPAARKRRP
ncbi:MAG TPA: tetraacyldisaccharide 4'-kinase [Caulobacteraceae bacterium]|nr:tetraacyldisaccharide 4'-kinase [Caulobacteraceae bacterium]